MTTNIEWTSTVHPDGSITKGETWNPTVGCHKVSPGCKHCYAETMHKRLTAMGTPKYAEPFRSVRFWAEHLSIPLRWRAPRRVFVNSMSDLFHEDVTNEQIAAVFGVMAACGQHTFQVLTKRPERMMAWFAWGSANADPDAILEPREIARLKCGHAARIQRLVAIDGIWPLPNVHIGVSVESVDYYDRIVDLQATPAAVRFLSLEPLLGPLPNLPLDGIGWVIVGGESGTSARPCDVEWIRDVVRQCKAAAVRVFVKQLGAFPQVNGRHEPIRDKKGGDPAEWPADLRVREWPEPPPPPVVRPGELPGVTP